MHIGATAKSSSLLLLLYGMTSVPSANSGEYYKCVDEKGRIHISNIACPSQSEKTESHKLGDMSEKEFREAQRKDREKEERDRKLNQKLKQIEEDTQQSIWELQNLSPRQRKEMEERRFKQELLDAVRNK